MLDAFRFNVAVVVITTAGCMDALRFELEDKVRLTGLVKPFNRTTVIVTLPWSSVPIAIESALADKAKSGAMMVSDTNTSWSKSAVAPVTSTTVMPGSADGLTESVRVEVPCPVMDDEPRE